MVKPKICSRCGDEYTVGNSHFKLCHKCNRLRLDGKLDDEIKERKSKIYSNSIKQISMLKTRGVKIGKDEINPYGVKNQKELFVRIWNERPHICVRCKKKLGEEPIAHYFSHIYPKSIAPHRKLDPDNIELLCIDCHQEHDFGKRSIKL